MLLAIDVGNTNTVLGVFNKDKLEQSWRVKTDPRDTADELWLQYSALVDGFDITGVAICSTVPAVLREIRKLIDEHYSDINTTIIEPGGGGPELRALRAFADAYNFSGDLIIPDTNMELLLDVVTNKLIIQIKYIY